MIDSYCKPHCKTQNIAWALLKLEAQGLSESTTLYLINRVFMYYLLAHMAYEIWNRILSKKEQNFPLYSVQNLPNREMMGFSTLLVFSFLPHFPIPDSQTSCKSEIVLVQVLAGKIAILFLFWNKQIRVTLFFLNVNDLQNFAITCRPDSSTNNRCILLDGLFLS